MTMPSRMGGVIHHYIFEDYYLRDSRTILLKSELKYLERNHGKLVNHWVETIWIPMQEEGKP